MDLRTNPEFNYQLACVRNSLKIDSILSLSDFSYIRYYAARQASFKVCADILAQGLEQDALVSNQVLERIKAMPFQERKYEYF